MTYARITIDLETDDPDMSVDAVRTALYMYGVDYDDVYLSEGDA
jgi:hypothetical protein